MLEEIVVGVIVVGAVVGLTWGAGKAVYQSVFKKQKYFTGCGGCGESCSYDETSRRVFRELDQD